MSDFCEDSFGPRGKRQLGNRLQNSRIFFANVSDGPYSNERSGASVKTARENGERRVRLAHFALEDHAYGASPLPKTSENDCFAVSLRNRLLYYCIIPEETTLHS